MNRQDSSCDWSGLSALSLGTGGWKAIPAISVCILGSCCLFGPRLGEARGPEEWPQAQGVPRHSSTRLPAYESYGLSEWCCTPLPQLHPRTPASASNTNASSQTKALFLGALNSAKIKEHSLKVQFSERRGSTESLATTSLMDSRGDFCASGCCARSTGAEARAGQAWALALSVPLDDYCLPF